MTTGHSTFHGRASGPRLLGRAVAAAGLLLLVGCQTYPYGGTPFSPTGYSLNGTEPFWGGTIIGTTVVYSTPENIPGETVATTRTLGPAQEVYSGSLDGQAFVVTLTPNACSNGMSDHNFAFDAVVQVRGETRTGCADPR